MPSKASACKPWRSHKEDAIKTLLEVLRSKTFIMMKEKNMVMIAISLLMTIQTSFERKVSKQILLHPEA